MEKEKLEQLRKVFEVEIESIIENVKNMYSYFESKINSEEYITNKADQLICEVKIRIK